jgi:uncharacterized protein YkwD
MSLTPRGRVPMMAADSAPDSVTALFIEQNEARLSARVPALGWDARLAAVAQSRVADMLSRGYFAHVYEGVDRYVAELAAAGLTYAWAGENLSLAYVRSGANAGSIAAGLFMGSPTHKANILEPAFDVCGIATGIQSGSDLMCVVFAGGLS